MEVTQIDRVGTMGARNHNQPGFDKTETLVKIAAAVRNLNSLHIHERQFVIMRDPESHKFVVRILDRTTGDTIDQFPSEDVLAMAAQFESMNKPTEGTIE